MAPREERTRLIGDLGTNPSHSFLRFSPPSPVLASGDVKREPTRSRALPPLRAAWERACRAVRWLDDSWIGDLIGAICIFLIPVAGLFLGMVFE